MIRNSWEHKLYTKPPFDVLLVKGSADLKLFF